MWALSKEAVLKVSQVFFIKMFLKEQSAIIVGCSGQVVLLPQDLAPNFFQWSGTGGCVHSYDEIMRIPPPMYTLST